MAWLPTDPEQDKDKQAADPAAGPVLGAPGAAPIQGSGGGQAAATGAPTKSGSFTNLNNYVTANAGNDATMGAAARGGVQQSANKADAAGTSVYDTGTTAAEAGTVRDDGTIQAVTNLGVVKPVTQTRTMAATPKAAAGAPAPARAPAPVGRAPKPAGTPVVSAPVQQQAATPKAAPAAPAAPINTEQFGKQYNAEYSGPNTASAVSGYGDADAAYGKVDAQGKLAKGDLSDRGQLLDNVYGQDGKQYSQGEKRLDSFILGAGSEGRQALDGIGNDFGDYSGGWRGIQSMLGGKIDEGKATTAATRQGTRDASGGAYKSLDPFIKAGADKAASENTDNTNLLAAAQKRDPAALSKLGLNDEAINFLNTHPDVDIKSLLNNPAAFNTADFAESQTIGNYSQLMSLLSGAGDTTYKASGGDLTTTGGRGTSFDGAALGALNKSGGAVSAVEKKLADKLRDQSDTQSMIARNPVTYLLQHATDFDMNPDDIVALSKLATPTEIQSLFSNEGAAGLGNYTSDPAFAGLYKLLGLDPSALTKKGSTGTGVSFDKNKAAALLAERQPPTVAKKQYISTDGKGGTILTDKAPEQVYATDPNGDGMIQPTAFAPQPYVAPVDDSPDWDSVYGNHG